MKSNRPLQFGQNTERKVNSEHLTTIITLTSCGAAVCSLGVGCHITAMRRNKYCAFSNLVFCLAVISLLLVICNYCNNTNVPWKSCTTHSVVITRKNLRKKLPEKSYIGENGSEVILTNLEEKKYKNEISKGWRDYAFNEYVSSLISLGKAATPRMTVSRLARRLD